MASTVLSRRRSSLTVWALSGMITVLALADAVIHFRLDYVLFHGKLWGSSHPGPPGAPSAAAGGPPGAPGAAPGGPSGAPRGAPSGPPPGGHTSNPVLRALDIAHITGLPLNELFVLNAIGYVVLAAVFWFVQLRLPRWHWLIDVALIGYTTASIIGWWDAGKPNPQNLGYLSKGLEAALILVLVVHIGFVLRRVGARRIVTIRAA